MRRTRTDRLSGDTSNTDELYREGAGRLTDPKATLAAFRIGYGLWGTFGVVIGAVSLFNLMAKSYNLRLRPVVRDIINTYRWTFHTVFLDPMWRLVACVGSQLA